MALVAVYQGDYVDDEGVSRRWQIVEEGGSFVANLTGSGRGFLETSWQLSDKDEYSPFLVSSTTLRVIDTSINDLYGDLVEALGTNQSRKYQLYIRDMTGGGDGTLSWRGYVRRGAVTAQEDGLREITVYADDGIGSLKDRTFTSTSTTVFGDIEELYSGRVTYTSILSTLLLKTGLGGDIYISCGQYPRLKGAALTANGGSQLAATQNPMDFVYVDRGVYRTRKEDRDGEKFFPIKVYDVLEDVLRTWGATLFQHGGDWHVIQVNKRGNNTLRRWRYDQDGAAVGSPNYADVTSHVITPSDENYERTPGGLSQLENYDSVTVVYEHGEYKFMPNPGFDFDKKLSVFFDPQGWTIDNYAGGGYQNIGNGDGQFVSKVIQTNTITDIPTVATGTGSTSIDAFVDKWCSETGAGRTSIATVDGLFSGTITTINIDAYDGYPVPTGGKIWLESSGIYTQITLTSSLDVGDTKIDFSSVTPGTVTGVYGTFGSNASSSSTTEVGASEKIQVLAEYLPTYLGELNFAPAAGAFGSLRREIYYQVKLVGSSGTRYLQSTSGGLLEWTSSVAWIANRFTTGSWNIISALVQDPTPFEGTVTITIGPALEYRAVTGTIFGARTVNFTTDEVVWDNVDVRPVLQSGLTVNTTGRSVTAYADTQDTEIERNRSIQVTVGDSPINPADFGMSLDSDGLIETADWEEDAITGSASGVAHEQLLAKAALRSMRAPREVHSATYFGISTLLTPWYILSRSGSEYAPTSVRVNWVASVSEGSWYKVTETGFTDSSQTVYQNAALVSSRGGIGTAASGLLSAVGSSFFADGSKAITRTDAAIAAGVVTSISVESITEPIFKDGDRIVLVAPDLNFVEAQISADQDALATSLSIEDPDNPGTGVTFDYEMPAPAAIYFIEQKLLTLARLGEQGFAVTVLGENIGKVDGAQSGTLTSLNVKEWSVSIASGTTLYLDDDTTVTLNAAAPRGSTTISFSSTAVGSLADNQVIKPAGSVPRADFKVTADAITSYLGNPGEVIATVSGTVTYDGGNTRSSVPVSTSLAVDLKAGDPVLFYASDGNIVKGIVNADVSAGATPILIDGDISGTVESGDKVVPGSLTGLRIDMSGISVLADRFASTNYSAGSAGWAILGDGSAEFNNITARGSITLTSASSGLSKFTDAGNLAFADNLDDVPDGSTYSRVVASALSSGQVLLSQAVGNLDNIGDGTTYGRVLSTAISAGNILLSSVTGDLDDLSDGSTYARVLATSISAGQIILAQATGDIDDIADGSTYARVLSTELSAGSITILGTGGATVITGGSIQSNSIVSGDIAANTITATNIAAGTITATEIAAGTITATQIAAGTITATQISLSSLFAQTITLTGSISGNYSAGVSGFTINGTSGSAEFNDVTVRGVLVADTGSSIDGQYIVADSITATQIATGTITADRISAGTITSDRIATGAIITNLISAGAVTTSRVAAGAITANEIATGTITATQIAAGTITATQIASGTITATQIASGTITANEVSLTSLFAQTITLTGSISGNYSAGVSGFTISGSTGNAEFNDVTVRGVIIPGAGSSVDGQYIVADSITATNIAAGTITATEIAAGTITATQIAAATITGSNIAANTIAAANIIAGTITATEIASSTITGANIAAGTITASNISAGTITATELNISTLSAITTSTGSLTVSGTFTLGASGSLVGDTGNLSLTRNQLVIGGVSTYVQVDAGLVSVVSGSGTTSVSSLSVSTPALTVSGSTATVNGSAILTAAAGVASDTINDTEFRVDSGETEYRQRSITVTNGQITAAGSWGSWTEFVHAP